MLLGAAKRFSDFLFSGLICVCVCNSHKLNEGLTCVGVCVRACVCVLGMCVWMRRGRGGALARLSTLWPTTDRPCPTFQLWKHCDVSKECVVRWAFGSHTHTHSWSTPTRSTNQNITIITTNWCWQHTIFVIYGKKKKKNWSTVAQLSVPIWGATVVGYSSPTKLCMSILIS